MGSIVSIELDDSKPMGESITNLELPEDQQKKTCPICQEGNCHCKALKRTGFTVAVFGGLAALAGGAGGVMALNGNWTPDAFGEINPYVLISIAWGIVLFSIMFAFCSAKSKILRYGMGGLAGVAGLSGVGLVVFSLCIPNATNFVTNTDT